MDPNQTSLRSISSLLKLATESDIDSDSSADGKLKMNDTESKSSNTTNKPENNVNSKAGERYGAGESTIKKEDDSTRRRNFLSVGDAETGECNSTKVRDAAAAYKRQLSHVSLADSADAQAQTTHKNVTFFGDTEEIDLGVEMGSVCSDIGPTSPKSVGSASSESSAMRRKRYKEYKTKSFIGLLFILIVCGVSLVFHFYNFKSHQIAMGKKVVYDEDVRSINFYDKDRKIVLTGILGVNLHPHKLPTYCEDMNTPGKLEDISDEICLIWKDLADLRVDFHEDENCYDITWTNHNPEFLLQDCFDLGDSLWYGMGLVPSQKWPLNSMNLERTSFLTGTVYDNQTLGPVLEPYWLSSNGISIMVNSSIPLHVSFNSSSLSAAGDLMVNNNRLCLYSDYEGTPYPIQGLPHLTYTVCVGDDIAQVHNTSIKNFSNRPEKAPLDNVLTYPVWSTLPYLHLQKNGEYVNQSIVEAYVDKIVSQGYKRSMLILDTTWQETPGELQFNGFSFPDPNAMIQDIKSKGFKVVFSVDPYVNYDSEAFQEAVALDFLVHIGHVPGLTRWWEGAPGHSDRFNIAGVVDMYPEAQAWLYNRTNNLSNTYNIDGYYWLGGQIDMQPYFPTFRANFTSPNEYQLCIAELGASLGELNIQQSGYKSQHVPGMLRVYGLDSTWNGSRGIKSVIPTILTLGILGYPYVLPDVIGGNAYKSLPSKELYIRWMELSAFLPTMHFSIPPEFYDNQTIQVAKSMIDLHVTYVAPVIKKLAAESMETSLPIIRPLWLVAPDDPETFSIDDQFLIGDDILVAPILVEGDKERTLYLPTGMWLNKMHGNIIQGPKWVKSLSVPISKIAYFERK